MMYELIFSCNHNLVKDSPKYYKFDFDDINTLKRENKCKICVTDIVAIRYFFKQGLIHKKNET